MTAPTTVAEVRAWHERRIEFWQLAKGEARGPIRQQKCDLFIVAHRAAVEFIDGVPHSDIPPEFDPEKWKAQVGRQF